MRERLTLNPRDQQRIEVVTRWISGVMTSAEATSMLGCSQRNAWRLRRRLLERGPDGLVHGNRDRPSARRIDQETRATILALAGPGGRYRDINDCHLAELLAQEEGIAIGRSTLRRLLRSSGLASPRHRRRARYRSRRERMAQAGLLVQVDGSPHDWLEGRGPRLTLVGGIDDATGVIVGAVFRENEDGAGYLEVLRQMCSRHGIPASLYRDRSGIFSPTATASAREDATQVGRALVELGIGSIPASSPQAKGRVERLWGTCQDRLVTVLRLAGATDIEAANSVLSRFIPDFNRRFGVPAAIAEPAWRPKPARSELGRICAFRWRRSIGNDNTVRLEGAVLQLPRAQGGRGLAGRKVEVQLRLDGRLLVELDGRTLLAVSAPPDPARLREIKVLAPSGPAPAPGGAERPGYGPPPDHPWLRPYRTMPERRRLTESLSK
jgi:transposase